MSCEHKNCFMCKKKNSNDNLNTAILLLHEVISKQGHTISYEMVARISNFLKEVDS